MVGVIVSGENTGDCHVICSDDVDELNGGVGRVDEDALADCSVADRVDEVDHLLSELVALGEVAPGEELAEVETIVSRCAVHVTQRTLNAHVDQ